MFKNWRRSSRGFLAGFIFIVILSSSVLFSEWWITFFFWNFGVLLVGYSIRIRYEEDRGTQLPSGLYLPREDDGNV